MSSHALSAIHHIVIRWFRQVRPVRRSAAKDSVPGVVQTSDLPPAQYDAVVHALTCPHCGRTLPIAEWILIETGYSCYWSLYEPDEPGGLVTAGHSEFSEDGDHTTPQLAHDSHDCYRSSRVPENFEWNWN